MIKKILLSQSAPTPIDLAPPALGPWTCATIPPCHSPREVHT
jgi:hypothetical protein